MGNLFAMMGKLNFRHMENGHNWIRRPTAVYRRTVVRVVGLVARCERAACSLGDLGLARDKHVIIQ